MSSKVNGDKDCLFHWTDRRLFSHLNKSIRMIKINRVLYKSNNEIWERGMAERKCCIISLEQFIEMSNEGQKVHISSVNFHFISKSSNKLSLYSQINVEEYDKKISCRI